jgi:hypothetical protein
MHLTWCCALFFDDVWGGAGTCNGCYVIADYSGHAWDHRNADG